MSIQLYTWPTPNGHKVQIMLEELATPYEVRPIDITQGAQFSDEFLAVNPNNKVPVIVDSDGPAGRPFTIFETGAILIYLADKFQQFMPTDPEQRYEALQWLMWQMGGLGPMVGQAQHFFSYAVEKHAYSIERHTNESYRLVRVMEQRLREREFLMGEYSIVDMACFPWIRVHKMVNMKLDEFPRVTRWYGTVRARPAVERGLKVLLDRWKSVPDTPGARENLFGDAQLGAFPRCDA